MNVRLAGVEHELRLAKSGGVARVQIDGREHRCGIRSISPREHQLTIAGRSLTAWTATRGDVVVVHLRGRTWEVDFVSDAAGDDALSGIDILRAPMPGKVLSVEVEVGQTVARGEALIVLESMKMHTELVAERDGAVQSVHVAAGDTLDRDATLITFEPTDAA